MELLRSTRRLRSGAHSHSPFDNVQSIDVKAPSFPPWPFLPSGVAVASTVREVILDRLVGLCLVAALLALAPAAHATPPDQSWITGLYDNADFDDVILLLTDNVEMIDPSTVGSMRPMCFVVGFAMPWRAESPPSSALTPARSRAPPATVPKPSRCPRQLAQLVMACR